MLSCLPGAAWSLEALKTHCRPDARRPHAPPLMQAAAAADESPASGGKKPRKKKDKNAPKNVRGCSQKRC